MTAIFMVWNTAGFALAADDSISVTNLDSEGQEKTLWTDVGEKIFELENHKLAIAFAGNARVNNIPIGHLLRMWESNLTTEISYFFEYVIDFLNYFAKCNFPVDENYNLELSVRCDLYMDLIKTECEKKPKNMEKKIKELINQRSENAPSNIYGPRFSDEVKAYQASENPLVEIENRFAQMWVDQAEFENKTQANDECLTNAIKIIKESFETIFETKWNENIEWHQTIVEELAPYIINKIDLEDSTELLFVGYGKKDWIPHLVKLSVHPFNGQVPRVKIMSVCNPNLTWHEALGQTDQIMLFLRGIDTDLDLSLQSSFSKSQSSGLINQIEEFVEIRTGEMQKKVSNLSIAKLEFVAHSFVELESLGSFLVEYLPGVGGGIKVVSMTR